jgi:hypothetical protein
MATASATQRARARAAATARRWNLPESLLPTTWAITAVLEANAV